MKPYLIGLHMTIDGWRKNRDLEGWRLPSSEVSKMLVKNGEDWVEVTGDQDIPIFVTSIPRLELDVQALEKLCEQEEPPLRPVRCRESGTVLYGFGDASGQAFGSTFQIDNDIHYQYGQWPARVTEEESSNWRELGNLVDFVTDAVKTRQLKGFELFIFTDNSTAENAFWKGTSTSPRLYLLVLKLRILEQAYGLLLHVVHVSGKRMIAQGTDGLSRANHSLGVMKGVDIKYFVPLNLDPLEREPTLRKWLADLTKNLECTFLEPKDWFGAGHGRGTYIWTAPPAAADVVVEQLGRARLKRPESMHIVVVPRIMTGRWRRHMTRGTDFYFKLDTDDVWNLNVHYEPLLIFVCIPYDCASPRLQEKDELLAGFRRAMLQTELSAISTSQRWVVLRKLLQRARNFCPL